MRSRLDRHQAGLDRDQAERGVEDDPGQSHAADRRPEQLGIVVGPDLDDGRVGEHHPQSDDVVAERPVAMVVLAVDVAGDRPADRDEPRSGRDRHEPSPRHDDRQQVVDADAGRHGDRSRGVVDLDGIVRRAEGDHMATGVLGRIAVRTAEAAGDPAATWQVLDRRRQAVLVDGDELERARGGTSPAGEQCPPRRCRAVVHDRTTLQTVNTATRARPGRAAAAPIRARA